MILGVGHNMYYSEKNHLSTPISFFVVLIIIIIVLWFIESIAGSNVYNNGICRNCGGHYVFQNAVGHYHSTNYAYKCDKCGNLIEVNTYYKE